MMVSVSPDSTDFQPNERASPPESWLAISYCFQEQTYFDEGQAIRLARVKGRTRPKGDIVNADNATAHWPRKSPLRHADSLTRSEYPHSSSHFSKTGYCCRSGPMRSRTLGVVSLASALVDRIFLISKIQSSPKSNQ